MELQSSTTNTLPKMYAVLNKDNIVVRPWVGPLEDAQKEYPGYKFIECTMESGMFTVGQIYIKQEEKK
jgi:hypothetical protein